MGWLEDEAKQLGGTLERKQSSVALVLIWDVKGADYENAENLTFFFDDLYNAQQFEKQNSNPPECPWLFTLDNKEVSDRFPLKSWV